jgi:hypothetical protein
LHRRILSALDTARTRYEASEAARDGQRESVTRMCAEIAGLRGQIAEAEADMALACALMTQARLFNGYTGGPVAQQAWRRIEDRLAARAAATKEKP